MVFSKSIIPLIEAKLPQFTPAEQKIADYFLYQIANYADENFSSKAVAAHLNVSEASLTRFAQKCNFRGFREFVYAVKQIDDCDSADFTQPVLASYQELLNKTYSLVNSQQIHQITELLLNKKRVFIYGKGSSGMVAREMKLRFMRIGLDCQAITDSDMIRMNEVMVDNTSLVIGITISGETRVVIESLRVAKARQASTVLFTANASPAFKADFDVIQLFAIKNNLENGRMISPQFPVLVVLDMLYADYMNHDTAKRERIWQRTYDALHRNKQ